MKNIKSLMAFTLAETLIVMGIIGVVAALTVPNLNASTGEKEKVAKVKKIYKDLNDAYGRAVAVYGPVDEWFFKDNDSTKQSTRFAERMLDFMKVSKNCRTTDSSCIQNNYTYLLEGGSVSPFRGYMVVTADGMSVAMYISNALFKANSAISCPGPYCNVGGVITVDIDGPTKGPAVLGKDAFEFYIDKELGILPYVGTSVNMSGNTISNLCFKAGFCSGWIIENDNMDYLKADGTGKCPDGKTVLDWTTNTSCK